MASDVLTGLRALEAVYCGFISLRGDAAMERSPLRVRNSNIMSGDTYIFRWDRHGRKGQPCLVLARGTMNSCLVKFEDGYTMVRSRNALQRPH